MNAIIHTLHVLLAGVWLGGVIFTTAVVSPALKAMKWKEAERVEARSVIGGYYAQLGIVNLVLLMVLALLNGLTAGFGVLFYIEYALLLVLFGLVAAHGAYFGRKLTSLARAEREAESPEETASFAGQRRALQRISGRISMLDIVVSVLVMVLAINA